ncbi:uncharacterized protein LOC104888711 [Beta vulgaris subsp. vulgaris]|uniref:uncharacterized protein LOC104888711 n=1 Tax=Beta vulgaris subsp. vulgaris TaxID=3555 RepID=UPI00203752B0|nr:uncharacterized protein LOC104888711 [Beta vulgaris subsp. vulgaris]
MRNKFTHQHLQQQQQQQQQQPQQRSKFLPMLCSSSTKEVIKLSLSHRRSSSTCSTTSSTVSEDPLSPKVGCMGQVKRNNKVVGFPSKSFVGAFTSTTTNNNTIKTDQICTFSSSSSNSIVKHHKLKRFFSTKNLTGSPTTIITTAATRCGTHKGKKNGGRRNNGDHNNIKGKRASAVRDDHGIIIPRSKINENCGNIISSKNDENDKGCLVNLVDMDPPLPVVKQLQGNNNGENTNLWKRRSKGAPLKSLQVQVTQQSCSLLVQASTV